MSKALTTKELHTLFSTKLESSGLTVKEATKLGFKVIVDPNDLEDHFHRVPAFTIPYHNPKGKETGFYRIRYLATTKQGFMKNTAAKERRYDQPPLEMPQLYLPALLPRGTSWAEIFKDTNIPLCFTEGELKAACATKHGLPTIALGGVWNYKSKRNGLFHLPIFDNIDFKGRTCYIIFDSDAATNPQVLFAQYKFAEELFELGAVPKIISIPKIGDKKHGIDDYIVEYGVEEYKKLITDEKNIEEFQFVRELLKLNSELALVTKPVSVVHYESKQLLNKADAAMMYANVRMMDKKLVPAKTKDGAAEIKYSEVSAFEKWLTWKQRTGVWSLSYEPGRPKFVEVNGRRNFNTWNGWGCVPVKGDVSLWKWLLDNIMKNAEPAHRKWFEQWCAYPLQNPGVKMFSCPIFFGQMKGTGKSLVGLTIRSIYGENGAEITDTELEDTRNVFAAEKQFILGNEVTSNDKRGTVSRLRNLITQHEMTINKKWQPDYVIRDTLNYMFTSNYVDAVFMEDDERRFFVHEALGPRLVDVDARKVVAYDNWLHSGEAAAAVFYYLLNLDLTGFDPMAPAPDTASKTVMVEASRSEVEAWAFKLKEDPDTCLRVGNAVLKFALYRTKDLINLYSPDTFKKPYDKAMANALRKAGFLKAANGESCPTKDGKVNLWVIRPVPEPLASRSVKICGEWYDRERQFDAATNRKFSPTTVKGGRK